MCNTRCYYPWRDLQIEYNFNVKCCCYYNGDHPEWNSLKEKEFDLDFYWNGEYFQKIRNIIRLKNYINSGCKDCQELKFGFKEMSVDVASLNSLQRENYDRFVKNFNDSNIVIDNLPLRYYLNFGLNCNLRCIMCSQEYLRKKPYNILPSKIFDNLKEYLGYALVLTIVGGEPLFIPSSLSFIDRFSKEKVLEDVTLSLITNGTLLNKYLHILRKIKRIVFSISLDSIENCYEYIRKGSSWRHIEETILNLKEIIEKENLEWKININCVLMKSNLKKLPDFMKWCRDNDLLPLTIVPVVFNNLNSQECIFDFPQLLNDVPNWENLILRSIDYIKEQDTSSAKRLETLLNELSISYYRLKNIHFSLDRFYLSTEDLIRKMNKKGRFMIWGTGSFYQLNYSQYVKNNLDNLIGFIDNNSKLWGTSIDNYPVYPPESISELQPKSILIASMFFREIVSQIIDMNLDFCEIY